MNKFKLVLSLANITYLAIALLNQVEKHSSLSIGMMKPFIQFMANNFTIGRNGNIYNSNENFISSQLNKLVEENKIFMERINGDNYYSINKNHKYRKPKTDKKTGKIYDGFFEWFIDIPSIADNSAIMLNAFRSKQDNAVLKHEAKKVEPVKNNSLKLISHKMKTSKKRIVITSNLQSRIVEVLQENKDIKSTVIAQTLETIKPDCTSKKDFKSAINSILFQLAKLKIVTYQTIGNNVSYYRIWNIA